MYPLAFCTTRAGTSWLWGTYSEAMRRGTRYRRGLPVKYYPFLPPVANDSMRVRRHCQPAPTDKTTIAGAFCCPVLTSSTEADDYDRQELVQVRAYRLLQHSHMRTQLAEKGVVPEVPGHARSCWRSKSM